MRERATLGQQIDRLHAVVLSRRAAAERGLLTAHTPSAEALITDEIEDALETLRWLQANETEIRAFVAERKQQGRDAA